MGLLNRLFKGNKMGEYTTDLGDTKTLKTLIGFLTPEQCAELFQTSINKKKREGLLKIWDENSSGNKAMSYLKFAKTFAPYKDHPLGYDFDSLFKDIDQDIMSQANIFGVKYESLSQVKKAEAADQVQKTIVPLLVLDAIRRHPEKATAITVALRNKGKAFMPMSNQTTR